MKKLVIAFLMLIGSAGILNAQTPQTVQKVNKKTELKITPKQNNSAKGEVLKTKTVRKTKVHTKANGTPDKRFSENKKVKKAHLKKDGTPDMRYKINKD